MQEKDKLTGKEARHLRALGHSLKPLIQLGKGGVSEPFLHQLRSALEVHELIKIKLLKASPLSTKLAAEQIVQKTPCFLAQSIGKTLLLFKPREKDPKITLPK